MLSEEKPICFNQQEFRLQLKYFNSILTLLIYVDYFLDWDQQSLHDEGAEPSDLHMAAQF
jgi:hypothetical protein